MKKLCLCLLMVVCVFFVGCGILCASTDESVELSLIVVKLKNSKGVIDPFNILGLNKENISKIEMIFRQNGLHIVSDDFEYDFDFDRDLFAYRNFSMEKMPKEKICDFRRMSALGSDVMKHLKQITFSSQSKELKNKGERKFDFSDKIFNYWKTKNRRIWTTDLGPKENLVVNILSKLEAECGYAPNINNGAFWIEQAIKLKKIPICSNTDFVNYFGKIAFMSNDYCAFVRSFDNQLILDSNNVAVIRNYKTIFDKLTYFFFSTPPGAVLLFLGVIIFLVIFWFLFCKDISHVDITNKKKKKDYIIDDLMRGFNAFYALDLYFKGDKVDNGAWASIKDNLIFISNYKLWNKSASLQQKENLKKIVENFDVISSGKLHADDTEGVKSFLTDSLLICDKMINDC